MGIAQGMDILLDLAETFRERQDVGFLFVGRGSESKRLFNHATDRRLGNVLFFDEIDPDEIPDLYSQCHIGMVALNPRHKSHNIPGKFVAYMQNGLPVLATINSGNDLSEIIRREDVGRVSENNSVDTLRLLAEDLLANLDKDTTMSSRCKKLFDRLFSVETAVKQITAGLLVRKA